MTSVKMHEKKMMKAYVSYLIEENGEPTEKSDEIRATLMDEKKVSIHKIVFKSDNSTYRERQMIPPEIATNLVDMGIAEVVRTKRLGYYGKTNIFNVPYTRSRTVYIGTDKYIQVRILAPDVLTLTDGISKIKAGMAQFGVQERLCVWTQMGHLSNNIADLLGMDEKEIETLIPDFDPSEVEHRKKLEQLTARLETTTGTPI